MSELGGYPPPVPPVPPPPDPTPPPASGQVPLWVVAVAGVVALAMVGALAFVLFGSSSAKAPAAAPPRSGGPSHPASWDDRVLPEVQIAQDERGLQFKYPVPVRFLAPAAFRASLKQEDKVTADDRKQLRREAGLLRAFGLLSGKVDLLAAVDDFSGSAVLAYYSFKDQRITVRGHRITPATKATLVHELTHALQDQYFHVGARVKALSKQHHPTDTLGSVLHAITEGDAERVEHAYGSSLGPAQRHALVAAQQREADQAQHGLASVPPIIVALESAPYGLGEGLVRAVAEHGGDAAVGRLFQHPPTHEVALLDPLGYVGHREAAVDVPLPTLQAGEKKFDSGEFGDITWYLMLAARLPDLQALHVADGWGGDSYVAYTAGGRSCAHVSYRGRTATDTTAMYDALRQWVAAAPGLPASVTHDGALVRFQSCDPGTTGQAVGGGFEDALGLDTTRTLIGVTLMNSGGTVPVSRCMADRLVATYSVAQLTDPTFGRGDPAFSARIQQIAADCR